MQYFSIEKNKRLFGTLTNFQSRLLLLTVQEDSLILANKQ